MESETRSFAVCVEDFENLKSIKKLHLNIWQLPKDLIVDIGIQVVINKIFFKGRSYFKFILYTPFLVNLNSIEQLYDCFREKNVTQLIFNDEVQQFKPMNRTSQNDTATLVSFYGREPLLLLKAEIDRLNEQKIEILLNIDDLKHEEIEDPCNLYLRFRYKSSLKSKNICISQDGGFSDNIFYDIRFNEMRLLPINELTNIQRNCLGVDDLYIFIIQEFDRKITTYEKDLEYIRFLEKEHFGSYLKELKSINNDFIIYYWKIKGGFSEDPERRTTTIQIPKAINMVAGFEKQKVSFKQFQAGVLINVFSAGIIYSNKIFRTYFDKLFEGNKYILRLITSISNLLDIIFFLLFVISFLYGVAKLVRFTISLYKKPNFKFSFRRW
ncbi:hypothetical protein [Desulfotruncus arcticus]|nr:hypothetical protein [Desulfotruncus arcticus]